MIDGKKKQEIYQIQVGTGQNNDERKGIDLQAEFEDRNPAHTTSDCGALLHIIKSSLGAGVLAMPYAFKNAGLALGIVAACFVGIIVTHTTAILVDCSQSLCKIYEKPRMSYADTVQYAFLNAHKGKLKSQASTARWMVNFFLFLTYYGTLSYYILIVASTFKQVLDKYLNTEFDLRLYILCVAVFVFPMGVIRLLKYLVPFSALANVLLLTVLALILREIFRDLPPLDSKPAVQPPAQWPIFFSIMFFSMEGIGTILPLENEMKNPSHLTHSSRLLYMGMVFVMVLNITIGFFGYLRYGADVKGVISLNLPNDWLSEAMKLIIALVVLFTFGLQMTAPMKVIWDGVRSYAKENISLYYYGLRSVMILGNVIIAIALPSLAGIIGLIGSMGLAMLGIFIPALMELISLSDKNFGWLKWRLVKNVFLMLFAIFFAIVGIYSSILEMING